MRGRAAGRAGLTAIPPFTPAPWYDRARPCKWCHAAVENRLDIDVGSTVVPMIRVRHEVGCPFEE